MSETPRLILSHKHRYSRKFLMSNIWLCIFRIAILIPHPFLCWEGELLADRSTSPPLWHAHVSSLWLKRISLHYMGFDSTHSRTTEIPNGPQPFHSSITEDIPGLLLFIQDDIIPWPRLQSAYWSRPLQAEDMPRVFQIVTGVNRFWMRLPLSL